MKLSLISLIAMHLLLVLILCFNLEEGGRILPLILLAYSFGVRHAFDPDHLAAIDNSIRILKTRSKAQLAGFYFSLGHASVVCLFALGGILGGQALQSKLQGLESFGSVVGPLVSSGFLIIVSSINLGFLFKNFGRLRQSEESGTQPHSHTIFTKVFAGLLSRLKSSWQLLPIGFLFGLGLDTAIEISILAINGSLEPQSTNLLLLALPLAFTAGMCTFDTANSFFISKAYHAFADNTKKRQVFTLVTVGVSVLLGFLMALSQIAHLVSKSSIDQDIGNLANFGIIATFVVLLTFVALRLLKTGVKQSGKA